MKRANFCCLLSAATLLGLSGCGGGSRTSPGGTLGRATFTLHWPERTSGRLIPRAANSFRVVVRDDARVIHAEQVVVRPAGGGTSTVTLGPLPVGELSVSASAYASSDGSGVALAVGSASLAITAGGNTAVGITLNSTIQSIEVGYTPRPLRVTQTTTLSLSARDAAGNLVLTSPDQWRFTSSNPLIARILAPGDQLQAIATGTVVVTATDRESGVSGTLSIRATPNTDFQVIPFLPYAPYQHIRTVAVNNKGWIAGELVKAHTDRTLFIWKPRPDFSGGDFTELPPLPGHDSFQPVSLSDEGTMLLQARRIETGSYEYWLWRNGSYEVPPASVPYVVKLFFNEDIGGYNQVQPLVLKKDGSSLLLPIGNYISGAHESGFVCGHTGVFGQGTSQAWRFKDGVSSYVPPPAPFEDALGLAVNGSGIVCVHLMKSDPTGLLQRGIGLWDGGPSLSVLPLPNGATWAIPVGMSDDGMVAGITDVGAMIWRQGQGALLNSLTPPGSPTLAFGFVSQVSARGYMAADVIGGASIAGALVFPTTLI
jgi:hypothetical protein